jgi:hypothetical protein
LNFRRVSGNFDCSNNYLTSLMGCPEYVGGKPIVILSRLNFFLKEIGKEPVENVSGYTNIFFNID